MDFTCPRLRPLQADLNRLESAGLQSVWWECPEWRVLPRDPGRRHKLAVKALTSELAEEAE